MYYKYGLSVVTPPADTPVPVSGNGSVKNYARILGRDDENQDIEDLLKACVEWIEEETLHTAMETTYDLHLNRFPTYVGTRVFPYDFIRSCIKLPRFPVQSVTHIKYLDPDGVEQTLTEGVGFQLSNNLLPPRILPLSGEVWPFTQLFTVESVTIRFVAGYADQSAVPYVYRQTLKWLFVHLYENRNMVVGQSTNEMPKTFRSAMRKLKKFGFVNW